MIAVVDIDGVLADATHRQHLVARLPMDRRPKDWDAFFAAVGEDPVLEDGRALVRRLAEQHRIVLLSGRPERTRADTVAWLERQGIGWERLVLRPDDDHRPAAVVKAGLIRGIGRPDEVAVVVDDDASVRNRLDTLGYLTLSFP